MTPEISIIIPVYNSEKYLKYALDSILNQSFPLENLEVIMVDDASKDNSSNIMKEYSKKYKNFKSIFLDEQTTSQGRNIGIANASGKYLMFLDNDDRYTSNACGLLHDTITEFGGDIAFGTYFKDINGELIPKKFFNMTNFHVENVKKRPTILSTPPSLWAKIYRREFIVQNDITFPDSLPAQDAYFVAKCFLLANGISFITDEIVCYRIRNSEDKSVIHSGNFKLFYELLNIFYQTYELFKSLGSSDYFKYFLNTNLKSWIQKVHLSKLSDEELLVLFEKSAPLFNIFRKEGLETNYSYFTILIDEIIDNFNCDIGNCDSNINNFNDINLKNINLGSNIEDNNLNNRININYDILSKNNQNKLNVLKLSKYIEEIFKKHSNFSY
ncbi:MAG: glycosyltransferase [Methanobrevibacter sp.]|jgi:glycosyltransferase involved in cell wall biosynthesis|nr:glycosyltransferase [Candidatus Methanoflexus mossambicus]